MSLSTTPPPVKRSCCQPGPVTLAAVSGGADSVAMLHILAARRFGEGFRLVVGHVDHGLRPESIADAAFVAELAAGLHLEFLVKRVRVDAKGLSPEEAARQARREALLHLAGQCGAKRIALAHTAEDQAETLLQRALCGTGPTGLAGIRPWDEPWWRPILDLPRDGLKSWLDVMGQPWREDPSNLQDGFQRNRVRHHLLPLIREKINPAAVSALCRLAETCALEEDYWRGWADGVIKQHGLWQADSLLLAAGPLLELHPARQMRLFRRVFDLITGQSQHLQKLHFEQVRDILAGEPGRKATLPLSLAAWREHGAIRLGPEMAAGQFAVLMQSCGKLTLPHLNQMLTIEPERLLDNPVTPPNQALVPADAINWPLMVRHPRPGDRMHPLGAPGGKKLARIMADKKLPPWQRQRTIVLADSGGILWASGLCQDARTRLVGNDRAILRLSLVDTKLTAEYN